MTIDHGHVASLQSFHTAGDEMHDAPESELSISSGWAGEIRRPMRVRDPVQLQTAAAREWLSEHEPVRLPASA